MNEVTGRRPFFLKVSNFPLDSEKSVPSCHIPKKSSKFCLNAISPPIKTTDCITKTKKVEKIRKNIPHKIPKTTKKYPKIPPSWSKIPKKFPSCHIPKKIFQKFCRKLQKKYSKSSKKNDQSSKSWHKPQKKVPSWHIAFQISIFDTSMKVDAVIEYSADSHGARLRYFKPIRRHRIRPAPPPDQGVTQLIAPAAVGPRARRKGYRDTDCVTYDTEKSTSSCWFEPAEYARLRTQENLQLRFIPSSR